MLSINDKIFCFYFPQFYPIPENDYHWGMGFTDWDNVKSASPLFHGHRQPRVPVNNKYYNQSRPDVLRWQVELAKKYGVDGFSFYHYWFDGHLTLEKPVENFLNDKSLDLGFCLTWANESWTKRWVGEDDVCIFKQTHVKNEAMWSKHFDYLLKFWSDDRYLKIDGRPVFIIYNPHLIKCAEEMFKYWNNKLQDILDTTLYIVSVRVSDSFPKQLSDLYDSSLNFEPRYSYNSKGMKKKSIFASRILQPLRYLPEPILNTLTKLRHKLTSYEVVDYQAIWNSIISYSSDKANNTSKKTVFYGTFVDWDNTPRYKNKSKVYDKACPESFYSNFKRLIDVTRPFPDSNSQRLFFINAWNEWSEGTYLEPDTQFGYQYLEKIALLKESE
ncbi:glycoside hydrolase family 99-like domain-containing protein [Photorhabdus akhurstii]|uniref:glycosyltransferase WbsX family protein n=1 Tax=Photorhabdus akhurstii TaxID=171438 RepID=UPI003703CF61